MYVFILAAVGKVGICNYRNDLMEHIHPKTPWVTL